MNIDFILDISCLWSCIAWRQLQTALKECAEQPDITLFFIPTGSFFPGLEIGPADRARLLESRVRPILEQTGLFVDFDHLPELSGGLEAPCRLARAAFAQKKYIVLDELFSAFFSFGRDISNPETIETIARYHGLTLEKENTASSALPTNIPEGLRAVPCLIFDRTTLIFGMQSVPCLKNMIRLAERLEKENNNKKP